MKTLGWIFIPILMLYRKWGALNLFQKIVGLLWAFVSTIGLARLWIPILIVALIVLWIKNKRVQKTEKNEENTNTCIYCGKPVGLFKKAHVECQEKHKRGEKEIEKGIISAFSNGQFNINSIKEQIDTIAETHYVSAVETKHAVLKGWEKSIEIVLEDRLLSREEEQLLENLNDAFQLDDVRDSDSEGYPQLVKASILLDLSEGKIPNRLDEDMDSLPFNFAKSEKIVWFFLDVDYYELKTTYSVSGSSYGADVGLFDDFYVSSGSFQGRSVESETLDRVGKGVLIVTNQYLYFNCSSRTFRIKFDEMVFINAYKDGLGIYRDALKANYHLFKFKDKDDPWFACNAIKKLAKM